ncbi:MAG TPA: hypothetical protein VHR47_10755 [Bacillota bacterium]|nr:hypothetical protein [Bacillota bacterium]
MQSAGEHEAEVRGRSNGKSASDHVLTDWFRFVTHPDLEPGDHSLKVTIRNFFKLYYFNILAMFAILFLVAVAQFFFKLEQIPFPNQSPGKTLILVAVLSVVEEVFFRLPLRYRPFNLALPVGLALTVSVMFLLKTMHLHLPIWGRFITIVLLIALPTLLVYLALRFTYLNEILQRAFKRRFTIIFYFLNITFALLHFSNYRHFNTASYLIAPIVTLPQLLTGLNLSYLRIRHGFLWGALYHIFWNMVLFSTILNKSNPQYGLELMVGVTVFGLLLALLLPVQLGRKKESPPSMLPEGDISSATEPPPVNE